MITTERLVLRRFRPSDAPTLRAYRSDEAVARYQSWTAPISAEEAEQLVAALAAGDPEAPGWFQYAIERTADGVHIGDIGVNLRENRMQAEIGYTLASVAHGSGYMTEALRGLLDHLFRDRGLLRVSAECDARNSRSSRLLERLGFTREGHRPAYTWIKGEWTDDLLFGLLARDWRP
jgi:aminoglycoside 6'-N-acetyltransferase